MTEVSVPEDKRRWWGVQVMGSLTAAVILHPTLEAADTTIADVFASKLRYGGIGINTAGQFHYMIDTLPWGAHPGETLDALESGQVQPRVQSLVIY